MNKNHWLLGNSLNRQEPAFEFATNSNVINQNTKEDSMLKCLCLKLGGIPGLDKRTRFDSHCHVFNSQIIDFYMIIFFLTRIFGTLGDEDQENLTKDEKSFFEGVGDFFDKLIKTLHFLEIGFSPSSVAIAKKLDCGYRGRFKLAPLMFDLDGCFIGTEGGPSEGLVQIKSRLKELPSDISNRIEKRYGKDKFTKHPLGKKIKPSIDKMQKSLKNIQENVKFFSKDIEEKPADSTKCFNEQIKLLLDCKTKLPGKIFPFLVVDPRKEGIYEIFKEQVVQKKNFTGVKIYCPIGYSPTHPMLFGKKAGDECVYSICEKLGIPIIAHCSRGGFVTFQDKIRVTGHILDLVTQAPIYMEDYVLEFENSLGNPTSKINEVSDRLNHPKLWELVLERYPNLKLDLAHWGGESAEWRSLITEMLRKYKNLYSDFACAEEKFFKDIIADFNDPEKPYLKEKLLYGSDYHILMLFSENIQSYLKMFLTSLSKEDWDMISITNPNRFFGL